MLSLLPPFRPDPFRFRPPKITPWLYPLFYLQNLYLLRQKFNIRRIHISMADLQRLHHRSPRSTLFLINHVNFIDPHILLDLSFKARFCPTWLAGIEPFDSGRGISGWFIQRAGAFSIDRGILDRFSLETAQSILDKGKYPLVIYPEGEAAYTNNVIQPFYPGASLFALNTAETHRESNQPVQIIPIGVRYALDPEGIETCHQAMGSLYTEISSLMPQPLPALPQSASAWDVLPTLIDAGVSYLAHTYPAYTPPTYATLEDKLLHFKEYLLTTLHSEHLNEPPPSDLSTEELMLLKNKLRSLIARKCYAPKLSVLTEALHTTETLATSLQAQNNLSKGELKTLARLETTWIGVSQQQKPVEKRIPLLIRHLKQQVPYATLRQSSPPKDVERWERQLEETRRIKMLFLLREDVTRKDASAEGIDECLTKLEILLFGRFVYRGPKEAYVRVGNPIDVKAEIAQHPNLSKKELQARLTGRLRQAIETLILPASRTTSPHLASPLP